MRWFLGLILVIALTCGVAYGVGRFLLPNSLEVTRTISIDRPRASVFAMINDLRIAKEWSPYYARDPDATFTISDEPGPGQSMLWVSTVRDVGRGRMSIVDATENREVQAIVEMADRATLNSRIELRPNPNGTSAAWTVSAQCSQGWINVPCRYMNLIMRTKIENDLDSGLARLKTLTEQLPNVDFEGLNPQFDTVPAQTFIYSLIETSMSTTAAVRSAEEKGLNQVRDAMAEAGLVQAGPIVRVLVQTDPAAQRMSFRVGYPFTGRMPDSLVGVQVGETPSGPTMHVMVQGRPRRVQMAYAQMTTYLQAHRIASREGGLPWEVVYDPGPIDGSSDARLEIFMPLQ